MFSFISTIMEGAIKKKIHNVRKQIQKKYFLLKHGREQDELERKKSLSPITNLLSQQLNRMNEIEDKNYDLKNEKDVKEETNKYQKLSSTKNRIILDDSSDDDDIYTSAINIRNQSTPLGKKWKQTPLKKKISPISSSSSPPIPPTKTPNTDKDTHTPIFFSPILPPTTQSTLQDVVNQQPLEIDEEGDSMLASFSKTNGDKAKWDRVNGPKRDKRGVLKFGDSSLIMNKTIIKIKGKTFKNTKGLRELILKHNPKTETFNKSDLENYKQILELSKNPITRNRSNKYQKIIKPIFPKGDGLLKSTISGNKVDYKYWDNPNEIVDRLKLLIASTSAGNNSHKNEIVAIIEELKEAKIIV